MKQYLISWKVCENTGYVVNGIISEIPHNKLFSEDDGIRVSEEE